MMSLPQGELYANLVFYFYWRKVAHLPFEIIPKQRTDAGARQLGVHGDNLIALANNYLSDGNFKSIKQC